jgi:predicted metal-dependent enzyme (double-stranded beta helix superfamily)
MPYRNYYVSATGQCEVWEVQTKIPTSSHRPYRLYRFLTDLENLLEQEMSEQLQLQLICNLVRHLLCDSTWLYFPLQPDPETGWSVHTLYDEPTFPLTVQLVAWSPGMTSPIHNHGSWGVVALLNGKEKNTLWQRTSQESHHRIEQVSNLMLVPGDIITFSSHAIHHIETLGEDVAISFNLYGETDYTQRFEFDLTNHTATHF